MILVIQFLSLQLLEYILSHNVFAFRGSHFLQVQGLQWGHSVSHHMPTCIWRGGSANSFMARFC